MLIVDTAGASLHSVPPQRSVVGTGVVVNSSYSLLHFYVDIAENQARVSDNEGFDDVNVMGHRVSRSSQSGSSGGNRVDDSLMVQYSITKNDADSVHLNRNRDQEQSVAASNTSKIVNISVNVNTWKPPGSTQYKEPRKVAELDGQKTLRSELEAPRSGLRLVKENAKAVKIKNGNMEKEMVMSETVLPPLQLQNEAPNKAKQFFWKASGSEFPIPDER
ncbi:hypothetical protein SESBI_12775 [Sesbania bispinosa]|nr:hypothetical protein SESBI_12775 [Sesbania bispinosa]